MEHQKYCVVSGVLFSLVALAHLLRIIFGMSLQVDEFDVPMFISWVGLVVPTGLALWAFRSSGSFSPPGLGKQRELYSSPTVVMAFWDAGSAFRIVFQSYKGWKAGIQVCTLRGSRRMWRCPERLPLVESK